MLMRSSSVSLPTHAFAPLQAWVQEFQSYQTANGSVRPEAQPSARALLEHLDTLSAPLFKALGQVRLHTALRADCQSWIQRGLENPPYFDSTRDSFHPPQDEAETFFLGPLILANGPEPRGHYFEFFYGRRFEPEFLKPIYQAFPHPKNKCQSLQLATASLRLMDGNCIVFFPENIKTLTTTSIQKYAIFFFNKFYDIYQRQTLKFVEHMVHPDSSFFGSTWQSAHIDQVQCYEARCLWGYMHDYFHHQGLKPFDENIQLKCNWFVGLLEELKVDCETALACLNSDIRYGKIVFEFILFERLFRYPLQIDCQRNFDSGTGVLLMEFLAEQGAVKLVDQRVHLNISRMAASLQSLVDKIKGLEMLADDAEHKLCAQALVRQYLPAPTEDDVLISNRFSLPAFYRQVSNRWSDLAVNLLQ